MNSKLKKYLTKNHEDYLREPLAIGFTDSFPEDPTKIVDTEIFNINGHKVVVRYGKLTLGKKNEIHVSGVTVDRVEIKRNDPLAGFGKHGYIEEAKIMNSGMIKMLEKHNLMICRGICSWPIVKVIVQEPTEVHLKTVKA